MIKVNVRAIIVYKEHYVLMGDTDKDGSQTWDLPGGELKGGKDVKEYLKKLVLEHIGYEISHLHFYEIVCRVRRRQRGIEPMTVFDFIFTARVDTADLQPPLKELELLPFANFEWLESGGRFRDNKVMSLLGNYHHKRRALEEEQLQQDSDIEED